MNTENKNEELSTKQSASLKLDDKYTLGSCVLLSVTGDVYSARLTDAVNSSDTPFFIKFLPESYPHSTEAMEIFTQEIDRVKNGYKVLNIIAFEQTNESAYLVFELPQGVFLSEKISQESSNGNLEDVLAFVTKIKDALNTLKSSGLVHGCVGMDSIYISDSDDVILLDSVYFSAKQRQLEQDIERTETIPNREAIYASPDACFGRAISEQDNVFSLACISYHLLSGQHPFGGENSVAALLGKVRPKRIDGLTDIQWQHLESGMAFAKESRLETMDDFISNFDKPVSLKKKNSIATNVVKERETVLARKQAKKILGAQGQKQKVQTKVVGSREEQQTKLRGATLVSPQQNKRFSFDNFQLDFPKWAWIPLSFFSGILVGMIAMGVAIEFLGLSLF